MTRDEAFERAYHSMNLSRGYDILQRRTMAIQITHEFTKSRTNYAKCSCGWAGKPTGDKKKSWKGHVRRTES